MDFFGCPIDISEERGQVYVASTSLTENLILPKRLDRQILETDKIPLDLLLLTMNQLSDSGKQGIFRRHLIEHIVIHLTMVQKKLSKEFCKVIPVDKNFNVTCYSRDSIWVDAGELDFALKFPFSKVPHLSRRPFDMMYRPRLSSFGPQEAIRYYIPLRSVDDYLVASRTVQNDKIVRAMKGRIEPALLDFWEGLTNLESIEIPEVYRAE